MSITVISNIDRILLYTDLKGFKECIAFPLNAIEWHADGNTVTFTVIDSRGEPNQIVRRKPAGFDEFITDADFVVLDLSLPPEEQLIGLAEGHADILGLGIRIHTVHLMPR